MIHELKTIPDIWDALKTGVKTFDVRFNDRGFAVNDTLRLFRGTSREWMEMEYLDRKVTYILAGGQFGIEPGYVVMGLGEV